MATLEPTIHILRSESNGVVMAHGHDVGSDVFLAYLLQANWTGEADTWDGQAVFPLSRANELVEMARYEGITIIDGPECLTY